MTDLARKHDGHDSCRERERAIEARVKEWGTTARTLKGECDRLITALNVAIARAEAAESRLAEAERLLVDCKFILRPGGLEDAVLRFLSDDNGPAGRGNRKLE